MGNYFEKLARKNIALLQPYQSARTIGGTGHTWLNANECPISTTFYVNNTQFNRYPECQPTNLILKYSNYVGISTKNILVSRGSDEAIELLMKVFCTPNRDCIVTFPPTYTMYDKISEIYGIQNKIISINYSDKFEISNLKKFLPGVKLIYICRPNNPTGHVISFFDIINILNLTYTHALVIIDEAYIEFCYTESLVYLLSHYPNLVILRTLSKSFGLAGIRCGFTLAHKDIISFLNNVISPYPLPSPVIDIACQALSNAAIEIMKSRVIELNTNKIWLLNQFKKLNIIQKVFYSAANYILIKTSNVKNVFKILWDQGIIVRNQDHEFRLTGCMRISIGTKQECMRVITALKNIK